MSIIERIEKKNKRRKMYSKVLWMTLYLIVLFSVSGCNGINQILGLIRYSQEYEFIAYDDGVELFKYNGSSSSVTIPATYGNKKVLRIGDDSFSGNKNITNIIIADGIKEIGARAFSYCENLSLISFGSTIERIEQYAFTCCDSLTEIILPKSLSHLDEGVFSDSGVKQLDLENGNEAFSINDGVLFSQNGDTLLFYPPGKSEKTYNIPRGVTHIGKSAFASSLLTTLDIPEGVTSIDSAAFENSSLENFNFPTTLTYIGDYTFSNTPWLKQKKEDYVLVNEKFLVYYQGKEKELNVPEGVTAVSISNRDVNREDVHILHISAQVSSLSIGILTAYDYSYFKVDDETPYFSTVSTALFNADKSILLRYPSGASQTTYTVPEMTSTISNFAFYRCQVNEIILSKNLNKINDHAFQSCSTLKKICIPTETIVIGNFAFAECRQLEEVLLSEGLECIGTQAFDGCDNLNQIRIPKAVEHIGRRAFGVNSKIVIIGEKNTYIQNYAEENGLRFKSESNT